MKRTNLNFLIDSLAFVGMLALLSTGLVLAHQLPPGSGGEHGAGSWHGASERSVTLLWGWTRHEWGDFHYWTAYALLAVLAIHLVLHWKWIVCVVQGKPSEKSGGRALLGVTGLVFLIALTIVPLVSDTSTVSRAELQSPGRVEPQAATEAPGRLGREKAEVPQPQADPHRIRGSMSFRELSRETGMSVPEILEKLRLPEGTDPEERVGRVLRSLGREMTDVRGDLERGSVQRP